MNAQGGYFVINGSEKVLIAQERMAGNHVYVFAKAAPSPVTHLAEIRSAVEKGGKTVSTMQIKRYKQSGVEKVGILAPSLVAGGSDEVPIGRRGGSRDAGSIALYSERHSHRHYFPGSGHHDRSGNLGPHLLRSKR